MEIQFTRIRKDFLTLTIEADAVTALLDAHQVGETGESVSDRLWAAESDGVDAFWAALADQVGVDTTGDETEWSLDEEDADEDESDDDDEDDEQDEDDNSDTLEYVNELIGA